MSDMKHILCLIAEFTVKRSFLQVEYACGRVKMGFLGIIAILVSLYDTYDPFINKKSNRNDKLFVFDEADSDFNHQLELFGIQLLWILEKGGFDFCACQCFGYGSAQLRLS